MFQSVFPQRALVTITFEGEAILVEEGTTVAAAVLDRAGGETRTTARKHDGRGPYCHMASVTNAPGDRLASQTSSPASSPAGGHVGEAAVQERLPSGQRRQWGMRTHEISSLSGGPAA